MLVAGKSGRSAYLMRKIALIVLCFRSWMEKASAFHKPGPPIQWNWNILITVTEHGRCHRTGTFHQTVFHRNLKRSGKPQQIQTLSNKQLHRLHLHFTEERLTRLRMGTNYELNYRKVAECLALPVCQKKYPERFSTFQVPQA